MSKKQLMITYPVTNANQRKYIPDLAGKIMRGNIVSFKSPKEDRYINSSDPCLWVLDTRSEQIAEKALAGKDVAVYIHLETLKRVTALLVEAFDDYFS